MAVDAAWQNVVCADCGKKYQCTPYQDYYHRPEDKGGPPVEERSLTNGVCESCLLMNNPGNPIHPDRILYSDEQGNMIPPPMPPIT